MKFFSLFTKTPTHHRFHYMARYYDEQKENRVKRQERIETSLHQDKEKKHSSLLPGSFRMEHQQQKAKQHTKNAGLIRLGLFLFFVLFFITYLTWGSVMLWAFLLFLPVYFYFKFIKR